MITKVKTPDEIAAMRESGKMLAQVLSQVSNEVALGMTTKDLAERAKQILRPLGGQPSFLGYQGFPDVLCVSLNDEVVHGIPSSKRRLNEGDLVSLDFGVTYRGMITDSALTVIVGNGSEQDRKLVAATKQSLDAGVMAIKAGAKTGDISHAVQKVLDKARYGIVRDLVGHGVGHELHEEPNIANYGKKGTGFLLDKNMTIAVEPMATRAGYKIIVDTDGWTIRTRDGSRSAHFEHTILVTSNGAEVLTDRED